MRVFSGQDGDGAVALGERDEALDDLADVRRLAGEVLVERVQLGAGVRLIAIGEAAPAAWARPHAG
jgi:hypothetical protein